MDDLERRPPEAQVPAAEPVPVEGFAVREERETLPDGRRIIYYSRTCDSRPCDSQPPT